MVDLWVGLFRLVPRRLITFLDWLWNILMKCYFKMVIMFLGNKLIEGDDCTGDKFNYMPSPMFPLSSMSLYGLNST